MRLSTKGAQTKLAQGRAQRRPGLKRRLRPSTESAKQKRSSTCFALSELLLYPQVTQGGAALSCLRTFGAPARMLVPIAANPTVVSEKDQLSVLHSFFFADRTGPH